MLDRAGTAAALARRAADELRDAFDALAGWTVAGAAPPRGYDEATRIALAAQRTWWPVFSRRFEGGEPA